MAQSLQIRYMWFTYSTKQATQPLFNLIIDNFGHKAWTYASERRSIRSCTFKCADLAHGNTFNLWAAHAGPPSERRSKRLRLLHFWHNHADGWHSLMLRCYCLTQAHLPAHSQLLCAQQGRQHNFQQHSQVRPDPYFARYWLFLLAHPFGFVAIKRLLSLCLCSFF